MLEHVQIIRENDQEKFAVIPFTEYLTIKELLLDKEKLEDYLDYLHMQEVKARSPKRLTLAEAKQALDIE